MPPRACWVARDGHDLQEERLRLDVERHQFKAVLPAQLLDERANRIFGEEQFPVVGHAARDVQHEDIIHPVLGFGQVFARRERQAEVAIFAIMPGGDQIEAGVRACQVAGQHNVPGQTAAARFKAGLVIRVGMSGDDKRFTVTGAVQIADGHR